MDPTTRKALTTDLSRLTTEIAAALRPSMLAEGPVRTRAQKLWADERVGDPFDVWTDLLSRRAAVLWVLKSLYVRVLEDRGLLRPSRIVDPESQDLFAYLARDLGDTAYLRWIYRDLASAKGGLPELFAPQPAELILPPDALSRKLIEFWRARNPETGELRYRFDQEHFDGRLMGDLYQDLDPVVKKRYALLQTPDFVVDFILDETLTPAIAEFGIETVRVLDPACGSGHFLLAAFKRVLQGMREKFPKRPVGEVVTDVLARVVGIDLNDYACALARARLVMTALEACGDTDLGAGGGFRPQVYWADALEQVEREGQGQMGLFKQGRPNALLTRPEIRAALAPILKSGFHAVVGNPPYIKEGDAVRRAYHREKTGAGQRYVSAYRTYSLGAPFTERMFQLCREGGFVGEITSNSFMRREFGKMLIERVLPREQLDRIVDTSGTVLPGHGTSTALLFGRHQRPHGGNVIVVMGKRGEPGKPSDPSKGKVWASIIECRSLDKFENDFVSIGHVPRSVLAKHPWSIGGGGAADLKKALEDATSVRLANQIVGIGRTTVVGEDDVWIAEGRELARRNLLDDSVVLVLGECVRDWSIFNAPRVVYPYQEVGGLPVVAGSALIRQLWLWKALLRNRTVFGKNIEAGGRPWWIHLEHYGSKLRTPLSVVFAFKATHNHFVFDRGGKVFKQTAPIVKLQPGATEGEHLVLLAQLNSSTACFWIKQVAQCLGAQGVNEGMKSEMWEQFYEHDGTKLESFPLIATEHSTLESFARRLDALARARIKDSSRAALDSCAIQGSTALRAQLNTRREHDLSHLFQMVALQEELDWLCYKLYGLDPEAEIRDPENVPPFRPGLRPFEISLAQEDAERRAAISCGNEPDEAPSAWFERHGWEPYLSLDSLSPEDRRISEARIERTAASRDLALIEQPTYKRRWYMPKYEEEEREAMNLWLADKIEAWTKDRKEPFTVRQAAAALRADPGLLAVGELLTGRSDFDIDTLVGDRIRADAVPNLKHHLFKPDGLLKRAAWEETWRLQHEEDAGKAVTPPVPPKYERTDYLKPEYWSLRGKLDVPKERFIAFTEVPPPTGEELLYGWAGWTHKERAHVLLALDEQLEGAGVKVPDRYGVLYGVWFLLPYVAWEAPDAARDFRADVKSLVGESGVTEAMLTDWAERFPLTKPRAAPRGKKAAK